MRFMIIIRANALSESGAMPEPELMAAMGAFHEELARAGVLLDAMGLQPSSKGWRVRHEAGQVSVTDGPFAETKELIAGFTLIQVRNRDEALAWARRYPAPFGADRAGEIEVRQVYEMTDFPPPAGQEPGTVAAADTADTANAADTANTANAADTADTADTATAAAARAPTRAPA